MSPSLYLFFFSFVCLFVCFGLLMFLYFFVLGEIGGVDWDRIITMCSETMCCVPVPAALYYSLKILTHSSVWALTTKKNVASKYVISKQISLSKCPNSTCNPQWWILVFPDMCTTSSPVGSDCYSSPWFALNGFMQPKCPSCPLKCVIQGEQWELQKEVPPVLYGLDY